MDKYPQKETVKINLFYSENLKDFQISETKESPALLSQGRANFSGRNEASSFPPQHLEFVSGDDGSSIKRLQTFSIVSIISPNLIHNSKKRDLKNWKTLPPTIYTFVVNSYRNSCQFLFPVCRSQIGSVNPRRRLRLLLASQSATSIRKSSYTGLTKLKWR